MPKTVAVLDRAIIIWPARVWEPGIEIGDSGYERKWTSRPVCAADLARRKEVEALICPAVQTPGELEVCQ